MRRGVVTPPYGSITGGAQQRAAGSSAPTVRRGRLPTTRASGAQRSVCGAGAREWVRIAAEITPKVSSNAGQSLSHGCAVPASFAQGSL